MKQLALLLLFLCCSLTGFSQKNTFDDVQTILVNRCSPCHQPDGAGPFSLISYEDFAKRKLFIRDVIGSNYMPPWKADNHFRSFANDKSLTDIERKKILKWLADGALAGNRKKIASSKNSHPAKNELGRPPDLTLKIDSPYTVIGNNTERFILFKVPFELAEEKNIEAIELYCNNKKIVHHINYAFCSIPDSSINLYTGSKYVETGNYSAIADQREFNDFQKNMVYYSGWIPGTSNEYYPKNFGWKLPKRGVIIFTVHYTAIAADEQSVVGVKLFFKKQPIEREVRIISLGSGGIGEQDINPLLMIAPNKVSTFTLKVLTPEAQSIMYVWPHMHYIGKEFYAYAVTPGNDTINLVHIPNWDFRWQELYRMKKLIQIPAGSVINMVGTYDNTANNPFNPNHPPTFVFSSGNMRSTDEMFTLLLIYVPYKTGDENISLE